MSSWIYVWAELKQRRGRTLLTLFSVVIAVSAIVAVTSATATTREAYQRVFEMLAGRADLEVVARGGGRFRESMADELSEIEGVRAMVPIFHRVTNLYAHGAKAKVLAVGIEPDEPESIEGYRIVEGRFPAGGLEVALEAGLADSLSLKVGEELRALSARGLRRHKLTGLWTSNDPSRVQQGGMLLATVGSLQSMFKNPGEVDSLHLYLNDSKQSDKVLTAANEVLPRELRTRVPSSRNGLAEEMLHLTEVSLDLVSALSFTTAVVIALTIFLMNVSERRRQIAILRALGATRRQIMEMICSEALAVGLLATLIGIPLGLYGGGFLMQSMGAMLQTALPARPALGCAALASGLSGPFICLMAAWIPARRASQVSPLEGMRPVVTYQSNKSSPRATMAGVVGLAITAALVVAGVLGMLPVWMAIGGLVLLLLSVVLLVPMVLRPGIALLTWPWRGRESLEAQMAARLVLRNAGRSSLTIGVLLIAVAAGVGASNSVFSVTDDTRTWFERTIIADFLLRAAMPDMSGQDQTSMDESLKEELVNLDGVQRVEASRLLLIEAGGADAMLFARDFTVYDHLPIAMVGGDSDEIFKKVLAGEAVIGSVLAEKLGIGVGDSLELIAGDRSHSFTVAGLATEYTFGGAVVSLDWAVARRHFQVEGVDTYLIKVAPGSAQHVGEKLATIAAEQGLLLQSFGEVLRMIDTTVAGVTGGLWVLLLLGFGVGALGVVNTLSISVLEQTRELGMLRAVGMRRNQVIKTIMGQALLMGVMGILAGGALGLFMARMINICLATLLGRHLNFAIRPQFIGLLLLSALAVVMISALAPALRAARLSPIQATRLE
ncbi:MAG TPA: FtsX-like permease family protein [Pirellulales bacterium]|jgi:putative ABC transport system permease protein